MFLSTIFMKCWPIPTFRRRLRAFFFRKAPRLPMGCPIVFAVTGRPSRRPCFMVVGNNQANSEAGIVARLTSARVLEIQRVGGGRNSRVSRVTTSAGIFALKQYPSLSDDPRDRLTAETRALAWMAGHGVCVVPRVIALERATNCAL